MFLELIYGLHYWYLIWFSIVCLFVIIMLIIPSRFFFIIWSFKFNNVFRYYKIIGDK